MNRALDIDAEARTAQDEAGVLLDALRSATELRGLDFGPSPSSHSRCTRGD
jgi:FAD/FMN-containing dehydrogenase